MEKNGRHFASERESKKKRVCSSHAQLWLVAESLTFLFEEDFFVDGHCRCLLTQQQTGRWADEQYWHKNKGFDFKTKPEGNYFPHFGIRVSLNIFSNIWTLLARLLFSWGVYKFGFWGDFLFWSQRRILIFFFLLVEHFKIHCQVFGAVVCKHEVLYFLSGITL